MRSIPRLGPLLAPLLAVTFVAAGADDGPTSGGLARYAGRPLAEALADLSTRGLKVIYSSEVVRPDMIVALPPASGAGMEPGAAPRPGAVPASDRRLLDALLAQHALLAVDGPAGTILVVPESATGPPRGGVSGVVRTAPEGKPVAGALVRVAGGEAGDVTAITDAMGRFDAGALAPGARTIEVRVPGLREQRFGVMVTAGEITTVVLDLSIVPTLTERIVVTTGEPGAAADRPESVHAFDGEALDAVPRPGGDLNRALQGVPGAASGDKSSAMSLRGGESSEVAIILDGLTIDEPYHLEALQRFAGIIDARAIGGADLRSGGFPAEYGDSMSGVVDLSTRTPAPATGTTIGLGTLNARLLTGGAAGDRGGSWLVSGRAWYPDAVFDLIDPGGEDVNPSSSDLLGRTVIPLGGGATLAADVLMTRDRVDFTAEESADAADVGYDGRYGWITLTLAPTARLLSRTIVSAGRVSGTRAGAVERTGGGQAIVDDAREHAFEGLKQDWGYQATERQTLKMGIEARRAEAEYNYAGTSGLLVTHPSGYGLGAYVADRFHPAAPLTIEAGLRWDRQTWAGDSQVSPRLNLAWAIDERRVLRASWGLFYQSQGIHQLQVEDGVDQFSEAQRAAHATLGFEHAPSDRWRWRVDVYTKTMTRLRPRYENLFDPLVLLPEVEPDRVRIAPERAEAKGAEVLVEVNRGGAVRGWGSYALASIEDLVDGAWVPRSWDQTHAVNLGLNWRAAEHWSFDATWMWHTGWPSTPVTASVPLPGGPGSIAVPAGPRNSERYPPYHRLDIEVRRRLALGSDSLSLFLAVANVYGRKNVCCVDGVDVQPAPGGGVEAGPENGYWAGVVPEFGVVWEFGR